jgi:uncharacterized protein YkwD
MQPADGRTERAWRCAAPSGDPRRATAGRVPCPELARSLGSRALVRTACVLALLTACAPAPAPAFGSGLSHVPASGGVHRQERDMFERLNRDRKGQGLPPLRFDERLSDVARHHSADMRDHHFFEHESPRTGGVDNRLDAAGYLFQTARENLSEAPDVERSQDGLLNSPPHHENIMSEDVTHVGIGIVEGGVVDPRNITVTQVFARPTENEAPATAQSRTLARLDRERAARKRPRVQRDARLMQLATQHLEDLDERASPATVERAGQAIVLALGKDNDAGSLTLSAQVVASSEQVAFPDAVLDETKCGVGIAMRRVRAEHGRPALQVLLLMRTRAKR